MCSVSIERLLWFSDRLTLIIVHFFSASSVLCAAHILVSVLSWILRLFCMGCCRKRSFICLMEGMSHLMVAGSCLPWSHYHRSMAVLRGGWGFLCKQLKKITTKFLILSNMGSLFWSLGRLCPTNVPFNLYVSCSATDCIITKFSSEGLN